MARVAVKREELHPKNILAHIDAEKPEMAETLLVARLGINPNDVWSLNTLGVVYRTGKKFAAAESCYLRGLQIDPDSTQLLSNYGNLLVDLNRYDEALARTSRALELAPDDFLLRKNRAVALRESKHFSESFAEYEACVKNSPKNLDLVLDLANIALYRRDFPRAWDLFEARLPAGKVTIINPKLVPLWKGEPIKGKRLLICSEQGFGDTILMARFLPQLIKKGAIVTLGCKPALHDLFSNLGVTLVDQGEYNPKLYDYQIAMMSLARLMEQDWWKWPQAPQLHVTPAAQKKFAWIGAHAAGQLRVGVLWSGSVTFGGNEKRAVTLDRFLDLARTFPHIQFYSFQKGDCEKDYDAFGRGTILPLGQMFNSFSETAAALSHMDLIVMTDSALCHLAGSQNVPVLDLLPYLPYWLYMPETHLSAVYKSVRYLRQEKPGDWDTVFDKTKTILSALTDQHAKQPKSLDVLGVIDAFFTPPKKSPAKKAKSKS